MWTKITRRKYEREGQRYASDVTPLGPALGPGSRVGEYGRPGLVATCGGLTWVVEVGSAAEAAVAKAAARATPKIASLRDLIIRLLQSSFHKLYKIK